MIRTHLLLAVGFTLVHPAHAAERTGPSCVAAQERPASAATLLEEADADSMNGIRIGRALGALGPSALPELRETLRSGSVSRQRVALYALGELGPSQPQVMADILPFVTKGRTREVRLNALGALGKLGVNAKDAVPAIVGAVTDGDGGIRTEARRALVKIGLAALPAVDEGSKARSGMLGMFLPGNSAGFSTFEGCNDHLQALYPGHTLAEENKHYGRIQPGTTVVELARIVSSSSAGGFDKDFALKDLARVGSEGKTALPALIMVLESDPSEGYRQLAAQAIGTLGADAASATEALAKALGDRDVDVRFDAAWALASIGHAAEPALERVVGGGTPAAQLSAVRALEMLYTKSAWAILLRHWRQSRVIPPYDETKLRALIGEPR